MIVQFGDGVHGVAILLSDIPTYGVDKTALPRPPKVDQAAI